MQELESQVKILEGETQKCSEENKGLKRKVKELELFLNKHIAQVSTEILTSRYKKTGRFEKLLGVARSQFIVKRD